jgi:hypothetical protein
MASGGPALNGASRVPAWRAAPARRRWSLPDGVVEVMNRAGEDVRRRSPPSRPFAGAPRFRPDIVGAVVDATGPSRARELGRFHPRRHQARLGAADLP